MTETPISIPEYSALTGLSRGQIYARITANKVVYIKDGVFKIYVEATKKMQLELAIEAIKKAPVYQPRTRTRAPQQKPMKPFLVPKSDPESGMTEFEAMIRGMQQQKSEPPEWKKAK